MRMCSFYLLFKADCIDLATIDATYSELQHNLGANLEEYILNVPNIDYIIKFLRTLKPVSYSTQKIAIAYELVLKNRQLDFFNPVLTTANGNCLYNAVSIALDGSERLCYLIKIALAFIFFKEKVFFKKIITETSGSNSFQQVANDSARNYAWGSEYHIFALSVLLERPLHIYSEANDLEYTGSEKGKDNLAVSIFHSNCHFTALLPVGPGKKIEKKCNQFRSYKL
jgi:hypothetical protein